MIHVRRKKAHALRPGGRMQNGMVVATHHGRNKQLHVRRPTTVHGRHKHNLQARIHAGNRVGGPTSSAPGANCGQTRVGWAVEKIAEAAALGTTVLPLRNCRAAVTSGPVYLASRSFKDLLHECVTAVQGDSTKETLSAPFAGVDLAITQGAEKVFGWIIRVTASIQNFAYGQVKLTVVFNGKTIALTVTPDQLPAEVIVFAASDNAGLGSIIPATAAVITLVNSGSVVNNNYFLQVETLNARDIGALKPTSELAQA